MCLWEFKLLPCTYSNYCIHAKLIVCVCVHARECEAPRQSSVTKIPLMCRTVDADPCQGRLGRELDASLRGWHIFLRCRGHEEGMARYFRG